MHNEDRIVEHTAEHIAAEHTAVEHIAEHTVERIAVEHTAVGHTVADTVERTENTDHNRTGTESGARSTLQGTRDLLSRAQK